ncbi:MAG: ATP-binding protein [candidate division KSB1 bacterium]|jgi:signal transduction histidine kinase|nr:ATP-binding protein [candidate division KSB1 bacterium]
MMMHDANMTQGGGERLLRRRKMYVRFVVIFMVLLIIAFNLGSWLFLNNMEKSLEEELAKRLSAISALASENLELTRFLSIDDLALLREENYTDFFIIRNKLQEIQTKYQLEGAYIIDVQQRVIVDAGNTFPTGTRLTHIDQDSLVVLAAWSGAVAVSPIHVVEGNRFKNGYAPITNTVAEVTTILVLEANADFFLIINLFKRGLIFIGLASLVAIILFSAFLVWSINLLIDTQESLRRTEKLAALGQMSASVAHEIRNPLGIIKATSDVIKSKYEKRDEKDELFDYIGAEVNRLNNLVNDFLSFARDISLKISLIDVRELLLKVIEAYGREVDSENINITLKADESPLRLDIDEEKIRQVIYNLLLNARQAMEGEGDIEVTLNQKEMKGRRYLRICVTDTGPGIEGDVEMIFEPFYTTKSSGSGLGLAISRQIVEKHGGWIDVETRIGAGTTMNVYLPI